MASFDPATGSIRLTGVGQTKIKFQYGRGETEATITAMAKETKPDWVKIFSQQGSQQLQNVRFPVGATFSDFKVEVHYPNGFTRFVTKKALLRTPQSDPQSKTALRDRRAR